MRAFAITMILLLVINVIGTASKLDIMGKGHQPNHPTEGVLAICLLGELVLMCWGIVTVLN